MKWCCSNEWDQRFWLWDGCNRWIDGIGSLVCPCSSGDNRKIDDSIVGVRRISLPEIGCCSYYIGNLMNQRDIFASLGGLERGGGRDRTQPAKTKKSSNEGTNFVGWRGRRRWRPWWWWWSFGIARRQKEGRRHIKVKMNTRKSSCQKELDFNQEILQSRNTHTLTHKEKESLFVKDLEISSPRLDWIFMVANNFSIPSVISFRIMNK